MSSAAGGVLTDSQRRRLEGAWNCRLTAIGRKSGAPRSVTIWFALDGDEVVLAGSPEGPQWYRNLRASEAVTLDIGGLRLRGRARVVEDEGEAGAIRQCFVERYLAARFSRPFGGYTRSTTVRVAIDEVE